MRLSNGVTTTVELVDTVRDVEEGRLREEDAQRDKLERLIEISGGGRGELESILEAGESDDGRPE